MATTSDNWTPVLEDVAELSVSAVSHSTAASSMTAASPHQWAPAECRTAPVDALGQGDARPRGSARSPRSCRGAKLAANLIHAAIEEGDPALDSRAIFVIGLRASMPMLRRRSGAQPRCSDRGMTALPRLVAVWQSRPHELLLGLRVEVGRLMPCGKLRLSSMATTLSSHGTWMKPVRSHPPAPQLLGV